MKIIRKYHYERVVDLSTLMRHDQNTKIAREKTNLGFRVGFYIILKDVLFCIVEIHKYERFMIDLMWR